MLDDLTFKIRVLENQEAILEGLTRIITPLVKDSKLAQTNNKLIDCYHRTRKLIGKSYVEDRT